LKKRATAPLRKAAMAQSKKKATVLLKKATALPKKAMAPPEQILALAQ